MKTSTEIKELIGSLLKCQGEIVKKSSTNPHFKTKYADLTSIIEASELKNNGLTVITLPAGMTEHGMKMITRLDHHSSGQFMEQELEIPFGHAMTPQGFGACLTYARRYCLAAWINMGQEDDDANSVSVHQSNAPAKQFNSTTAMPSQQKKENKTLGQCGLCGADLLVSKFNALDYFCSNYNGSFDGKNCPNKGKISQLNAPKKVETAPLAIGPDDDTHGAPF